MPMSRPDPHTVPTGRRPLVSALYDLYLIAGAPSMAAMSRATERHYADDGNGVTLSPQGVHNILRGQTWPRWDSLESLVRALVSLSRNAHPSDVEEQLQQFSDLWTAAVADGTFAAGRDTKASDENREDRRARVLASLNPRERELVELVLQGHRNRDIADQLHMSMGTVERRLYEAYKKLGINRRSELAALFLNDLQENPAST